MGALPCCAVLPRAAWILGSMWKSQAGIFRNLNPKGKSWHSSTKAQWGIPISVGLGSSLSLARTYSSLELGFQGWREEKED